MKINNYDYYKNIFILCLYMEYILVLDINYNENVISLSLPGGAVGEGIYMKW
jgi:hypothetical protein